MHQWDPMRLARVILAKSKFVLVFRLSSNALQAVNSKNLKVVVAGDIGTFEWDFVTTDLSGQKVQTAGCDLLQFVGDKVAVKNAFRNSGDSR